MFLVLTLLTVLCTYVVVAQDWEDTEMTTFMWHAISTYNEQALIQLLDEDESAAFSRAADGRGPLFWAYEFGFDEAINILESFGIDPNSEDINGVTPKSLGVANTELNPERRLAAEFRKKQEAAAQEAAQMNQQNNNPDLEHIPGLYAEDDEDYEDDEDEEEEDDEEEDEDSEDEL